MTSLANYQQILFNSILTEPDEQLIKTMTTLSGQADEALSRLAVYQNNYAHSMVQAVKDAYPVVTKLLGDEFFHGLALEFVKQHPPEKAALQSYGFEFISFIKKHPACEDLPYLSDVAKLEYYYIKCFHGSNIAAINLNHLLAEEENDLPRISFTPHPNCQLLASDYPVLDIWHANLDDEVTELNLNALLPSRILLYRNDDLQVETVQLHDTAYLFCEFLMQGFSIEDAWDKLNKTVSEELNDDDLNGMLTYFLGLGIFAGLSLPKD